MMYKYLNQTIPSHKRAEINEKILYVIDAKSNQISQEVIFNCYTGIGGLHNLNFSDFDSFHDFTEAKKELEMGQFFTPHQICEEIVNIAAPSDSDMVADLCCGMGNFFNYLSGQKNVYGIDVDFNAIKVAKHLYPDANISALDIRQYEPKERFDIVFGNPPFNLKFRYKGDDVLSQFYYCLKSNDLLNPAGLLLLITPISFMADEFWNKSQIEIMNKRFSFVGQSRLDSKAFNGVGVENFNTKIIVFQKNSKYIEHNTYSPEEFVSISTLTDRVSLKKSEKHSIRLKLVQEAMSSSSKDFEYKLKKYLYEIKTQPALNKHYDKSIAYVEKYRNQTAPTDQKEYEKWMKSRITEEKVLSRFRRIVRNQNIVESDRIKLVRQNGKFKIKAYSTKARAGIAGCSLDFYFNDLIRNGESLFRHIVSPYLQSELNCQIKIADKWIMRKHREYTAQSTPFSGMDKNIALDTYIDSLSFLNAKMEQCHFTNLQKSDMGLFFQKRYVLLNWQQGSGKTAVAFHYGKYLLDHNKVKNVFILAPALATNLTWIPFLQRNGVKFCVVKTEDDVRNIERGNFVIVANSMVGKLKGSLQNYMRRISNKGCLLFDESDEITNPTSKRTKAIMDIFRRLRYKLLATGTTTRNNIGELYSQLELLYNNSVNFNCDCMTVYSYDKENNLDSHNNDRYNEPFPPRGGHILFKSCFCPGKASVFGIEKTNQDVYNADELGKIIDKTIITRKFREFAGEKYKIFSHTVVPSMNEQEVYRTIVDEFHKVAPLYFSISKDSRKEAAFRIMRIIQLLIKSCSTPHLMPGYGGVNLPTKAAFIGKMIEERDEKIAIGCTTLESLDMYSSYLSNKFPARPLFIVSGGVTFKKRDKILREFEESQNGILICTQQSLKSSVNIPTCNEVIMEALQWNIPKMEQFYFRTIRFDSDDNTNVHFVSYAGTIEQNILALVLSKERLNEFIKSGEVKEQSEIFEEFGVSESLLESLMKKEYDEEGKVHIAWGQQSINN